MPGHRLLLYTAERAVSSDLSERIYSRSGSVVAGQMSRSAVSEPVIRGVVASSRRFLAAGAGVVISAELDRGRRSTGAAPRVIDVMR